MRANDKVRSFLWTLPAAFLFVVLVIVALRSHSTEERSEQLVSRAHVADLVERMRVSLATASDAERSAVLAITDEDSQRFANQSRAASTEVERLRTELANELAKGDYSTEQQNLARFTRSFGEFKTLDAEILALAVKNTNLKANGLAFGEAAQTVDEINQALGTLLDKSATPRDAALSAARAQVALLHIQTLLAPHIAEESEPKMRALETRMAADDKTVRANLDALSATPQLKSDPDVAAARAKYARYDALRTQILALSHDNTNVRSLSLTLDGHRGQVMSACQDALGELRRTLLAEPAQEAPVNPRHMQ